MPPRESPCDVIRAQIDDLARVDLRDMRLPSPVTEHVRECPECKAQLDQVLALAEHLEDWPVPKGNIETGVMTRIAQLERDQHFNVQTLMRQCGGLLALRLRVPVAMAALLLLGLFVSLAMNVRAWQQRSAQQNLPRLVQIPVTPTEDIAATPTPMFTPVAVPQTPELRVLGGQQGPPSWLDTSQLAPTTIVIILGAPPVSPSEGIWSTQQHVGNNSL